MPKETLSIVKEAPRENSPVANATVHDRSGFWVAVLALILASLGVGIAVMQPVIAEAKLAASKAEIRAEFAQQLADVTALANTSNQHARVALDKVEQTQVQLGAKGLIVPSTH